MEILNNTYSYAKHTHNDKHSLDKLLSSTSNSQKTTTTNSTVETQSCRL